MFARALAALLTICGIAFAETLESPPFVVEFDPGDREIAAHSVTVLQSALAGFAARLPAGEKSVRIAIAPSNEAFEKAFGADDARNIQGFASGAEQIVMKPPRLLRPGTNYDSVLRHELVHVLIARNTDPENMPRWFNEGIAMLVSNEIEWSGPTTVAWMYLSGNLIPYTQLHEVFEDPRDEQTFGEAYAQSLSMTRHLYDTLGEEAFWSFVIRLREIPFNDALQERAGMPPLVFYSTWKRSLRYTSWASWLVSGFFVFQAAAILTILAYLRKRRNRRDKFNEWAIEDAVNAVFEDPKSGRGPGGEQLDDYLDEWEEDEEGRWWR